MYPAYLDIGIDSNRETYLHLTPWYIQEPYLLSWINFNPNMNN